VNAIKIEKEEVEEEEEKGKSHAFILFLCI
jgi:hypothetical protein